MNRNENLKVYKWKLRKVDQILAIAGYAVVYAQVSFP